MLLLPVHSFLSILLECKPLRATRPYDLPLNPQTQARVLHVVGSQQILEKCIKDQFIAQGDIIKKTIKEFRKRRMSEREIKLIVQY